MKAGSRRAEWHAAFPSDPRCRVDGAEIERWARSIPAELWNARGKQSGRSRLEWLCGQVEHAARVAVAAGRKRLELADTEDVVDDALADLRASRTAMARFLSRQISAAALPLIDPVGTGGEVDRLRRLLDYVAGELSNFLDLRDATQAAMQEQSLLLRSSSPNEDPISAEFTIEMAILYRKIAKNQEKKPTGSKQDSPMDILYRDPITLSPSSDFINFASAAWRDLSFPQVGLDEKPLEEKLYRVALRLRGDGSLGRAFDTDLLFE